MSRIALLVLYADWAESPVISPDFLQVGLPVKETSSVPGEFQTFIKECRATARVSLVVAVTCQDNTAVYFGKSENISEGGMMIKSPRMLPLDSMITVRFLLPVDRKVIAVKVEATPVWIRFGYSMGIRFVDLEEEYREAIAKIVEQARAQPF